MEPVGEPPLDKSKGSEFDRMATDRGGGVGSARGDGVDVEFVPAEGDPVPGGLGGRSETEMLPEPRWRERMDIDPQTREVLAAAQASTLVDEQEAEGLFSLGVGVRPYLDSPVHWLRNGREAGAWTAGVMIALVEGQHTIYVRLKPEHVEGAVGSLVDAGYAVQRYSDSVGPLDFTPSGWHGPSVTIAVTRTER